jgi:hypothetical protein
MAKKIAQKPVVKNKKKLTRRKNGPSSRGKQGGSVTAPVSVSNEVGFTAPKKLDTWRFSNSELIGTVAGSVALAVANYYLNPGLAETFPWLSQVAERWQKYKFHDLVFHYITRSATSAIGSLILSPEYNVHDAPPATEAELTNNQGSVENSVWREVSCRIDCAKSGIGPKLIRQGNAAGDRTNYDLGQIRCGTVGCAGTDDIGKLWVSYDVELMIPQTEAPTPRPSVASVFHSQGSGAGNGQDFATAVAQNLAFVESFDGLGIGAQSISPNYEWSPPCGYYRVSGVLRVTDTVSEDVLISLELLRDGSLITALNHTSESVGNSILVPFNFNFSVTAGHTIAIQCTIIATVGNLAVPEFGGQLDWEAL